MVIGYTPTMMKRLKHGTQEALKIYLILIKPNYAPIVALKPFKASKTMTKTKKPLVDRSNGFVAHINATITRLGFTDKQAANYLGVPVFTLRKWLTGERLPNAATHKLIEVLHMVETFAPAIHQLLIKGIKWNKLHTL